MSDDVVDRSKPHVISASDRMCEWQVERVCEVDLHVNFLGCEEALR
jgi:hypothetical protein